MRTWQDGVANVHGRTDGAADNNTEIVIGSHYDTVIDGGKYDGALGIIVGIAAVKARMTQASCWGPPRSELRSAQTIKQSSTSCFLFNIFYWNFMGKVMHALAPLCCH